MLSALHGQGLPPLAPGEDVHPAEQTVQNLGAGYVP
jgi:hypothetical protein